MQSAKDVNNNGPSNIYIPLVFTFISIIALMTVRGALFNHESGDYILFLEPWVNTYRSMTFFEGLGTKISNYNPPYMYILNIIAHISVSELFWIKLVSVIFDLVIAFFVMKIVSLKTDSLNMHILAFLLALAIPTVIINSSMWGQSDSIYTAFAVGSIYFGLSGRSKMTYVFMALAFSFKFQAGFLFPILPIFIFTKKIKLSDCYMFFVAYLAILLPAILAGMPLNDALFVYAQQATYYSKLNLNIVNLWQFVGYGDYDSYVLAGLYMTGTAVLGLMYFTYVNRARLLSNVDFVRLAYLFAVIIPFMLPKMHDRYYFMADVLSLVLFLFDKRRWYIPVVTVLCSYIAYAYLLMFGIELIDYRIAALGLLFVIIIVLRDYVMSLYPGDDPKIHG